MKKDTFVKGALISTISIVITKILGIVYVIPFYSIVGSSGADLYSYGYNMYVFFLNFSTMGVPVAISLLTSRYNSLDFQYAKHRTFNLSSFLTITASIISTIVLIFSAPLLASLMKGDIAGGNSLSDISKVIAISASSIIVVTILSNMRGFLEGQSYINNASISQVIEQFVRVTIIVVGGYLISLVLGSKAAVEISIFAPAVAAVSAIVYLWSKTKKAFVFEKDYHLKEDEKKLSDKILIKRLIKYVIPTFVVSTAFSLLFLVDSFSVIKTLANIGNFSGQEEYILSSLSTWGPKLNVIVTAISTGLVVSLLPNIASDYTLDNKEGVINKTQKTLQICIVLFIPMVFGLSLLGEYVWTIFYSYNEIGIASFKFSIFIAFFQGLVSSLIAILQGVRLVKTLYVGLISGVIFKFLTNSLFMYTFNFIGIDAYHGATFSTIGSFTIILLIFLYGLKKEFNIKYKNTIIVFIFSMVSVIIMSLIIIIIKYFIGLQEFTRLTAMLMVAFYSIIGMIIYTFVLTKSKTFKFVFGKDMHEIIFRKKK